MGQWRSNRSGRRESGNNSESSRLFVVATPAESPSLRKERDRLGHPLASLRGQQDHAARYQHGGHPAAVIYAFV